MKTFVIFVATGLLLLAGVANAGTDTEIETEMDCEKLLRIRNQLEQPGVVLEPAQLSLRHSAGSETVGRADVAVLQSIACDNSETDAEKSTVMAGWNLDAGVDYHRNTDSSAEKHTAAAGFAYTYNWTTSAPATPGNWQALLASASYGRNVLNDTNIRKARVAYSAVELAGGTRKHAFGLLGGDGLRESADGTISTLYSYGIQPAIDYFDGYRVGSESRNYRATSATVGISAEWYPFAPFKTGSLRLSASWLGRHRIAGDDVIPKNSSSGKASIDFDLLEHSDATMKRGATISLQYQNGRVPENAFIKDETIALVFTYILDKR